MDLLQQSQRSIPKMVRRLEDFCEYRLRKLDSFSPEERKFHRKLTAAFQYIKGAFKKDGRNF